MIRYTETVEGVRAGALAGFFEGWPSPPSAEAHLRVLEGSDVVVLAWEGERVVGFITAISDGVLCAFIPLLEVLPSHRGHGIGGELVRRMLGRLEGLYAVDLVCDEALAGYYERLGLKRGVAMMRRNYDAQRGAAQRGISAPPPGR